MRFSDCLLISLLFLSTGSTEDGSSQFGLPGYIPDKEPLAQATPQLVLESLRDVPEARLKLTEQKGVFLVHVAGDPTATSYVFFGKGHWAYPSVLRFRRAQISGAWATHTSFLCGGSVRACSQLTEKLHARPSQVVNAPPVVLESDEIKRLKSPLPDGIRPPGRDFWISQWGPVPHTLEYEWRLAGRSNHISTDSDCQVIGPRYALPPDYPMTEELSNVSGQVMMIMVVDRTGRVIDASIERSSGNQNLDLSAINAASIMRFHMNGCSTPSSVARARLPLVFTATTRFPLMQLADFDASAFGY